MKLSPVDHLVLAGPNLGEAVDYATELLGIAPTAGGAHPGLGSRNALMGLGSGAYLEVIGPDPEQPDPAQPRPFGIDRLTGPTFVTYALRGVRLAERVVEFSTARFTPARAMQRRTTDGELLEWELAVPVPLPEGEGLVQPVPFLIDWGQQQSPGQTMEAIVKLRSLRVIVGNSVEQSAVNEVIRASGNDIGGSDNADNAEGVSVEVEIEADAPPRLVATIQTLSRAVELS